MDIRLTFEIILVNTCLHPRVQCDADALAVARSNDGGDERFQFGDGFSTGVPHDSRWFDSCGAPSLRVIPGLALRDETPNSYPRG